MSCLKGQIILWCYLSLKTWGEFSYLIFVIMKYCLILTGRSLEAVDKDRE